MSDRRGKRRSRRWCSPRPSPWSRALLAELVELPVVRVEALCEELARRVRGVGRGFVLVRVAGGYRFQTHPDLAPYVERFVLDAPSRAPVGTGARDARDRRVQAADLAGPDVGDPRRQRRGHDEHAVAARLRRGGRPRPGSGHRRSSTAPPCRSSSGSASTRSPICPRSATSCPTRRSSRRSSAGSTSATTRRHDETSADEAPEPRERRRRRHRLTCRERSEPRAAAEGPGAGRLSVRDAVRGADRRRSRHRRRRGRAPRRPGRSRRHQRIELDGVRGRRARRPRLLPAEQAHRRT